MIREWWGNELTQKRWKRFKNMKRALISLWIFSFCIFLSITAEFWANSKPIVMGYQGSIYFPVLNDQHPSVFGQEGNVTNYRELNWDEGSNWAVWPLVKWNPYESNTTVNNYPSGLSKDNWMGTDDRGRDVMSRLIYGFRYSIGFAFLVWFFAYTAGITLGAIMGFAGGWVDLIGQRTVEVFESMPFLLMLITLISMFGASMTVLVIFSVFLGWMSISTYMRAEFLKLRKREFIEAAKAQGVGIPRILMRHVLPNGLGPVITFSPTFMAAEIYALSALDYLGLGLPPPTPSWGELLQQAQNYFTIAWWLAIFPSIAMIITLTSLTFIGEGVREAFDPRK